MRKNRNIEYEDIPASLELAIEGCTIVDRGEIEDDEGYLIQRTLLMFAGETVSSWHHDDETTAKRFLEGWPNLSQGQLNQAMKMIRARIKIALREVAVVNKKSNWASWRPLRETIYGDNGDDGHGYY